jgi:hypothetical protein
MREGKGTYYIGGGRYVGEWKHNMFQVEIDMNEKGERKTDMIEG